MAAELAVPGEVVDAELVEDLAGEPVYHGCVTIEWPKPVKTLTFPRPMVARKISICDAETGTPINSVETAVLHASASNYVVAELTMFADLDGLPVLAPGVAYPDDDGKIRTGTFSFLVSEMRIR